MERVISTTAFRLSAPLRARIRIRRPSTVERVSWRRAGFIAEYDLLAGGWTVEAVDNLGGPEAAAGATRFFRLDDASVALEARAALKARKPSCTSGG